MKKNDFNYENLKNAIVLKAVDDWREAQINIKSKNKRERINAEKIIYETERFFLSDYFYLFSNIDGVSLLNKLKGDIK